MKKKTYLLSTGEFAKLIGINKRTLHYYHEIGLFSPVEIDENGYHYYSSLQMMELEMILIFRKLDLPIEEIKRCMVGESRKNLPKVLQERKKIIESSIQQLLAEEVFLQKKLDQLELGASVLHGQMEIITLPEEKILLSSPIAGTYDANDFSVASEFALRLKKEIGLYENFGSRIHVDEIEKRKYDHYSTFFAYVPENMKTFDEIRPAGTYLRAYAIGDWSKLRDVYQEIITYTKEQGIQLHGYAYEEGLNEMTLEKDDDYITKITIGIKVEK